MRHFGRERLLVERSEDFWADGEESLRRVLAFAGVSAVSDLTDGAEGARPQGRLQGRHQGSYRLSEADRNVGRLWGGEGYVGSLAPAERRRLEGWYLPHNRELYAMIGRDMGWGGGAADASERSLLTSGSSLASGRSAQLVEEAAPRLHSPLEAAAEGARATAAAPRWTPPLRPEL